MARFLLPSALVVGLIGACSKDGPPPQPGFAQTPPVVGSSPSPAASTTASADANGWVAVAPKAPAVPGPIGAAPRDANVILLSIDSLRADMPWNGYPRAIAPRLTELETRAVSYRRAYAMSSYTSMSLGGLLGARFPSELVRSGYFFGTYRKDVFFPKLLQRAGIHTMGVHAHMYFKGAGFDQGFDDWRLVPGITFDPNTDRDITSPGSEKLAEQLLGDPANESRRFFFWAHFLDPHDLYQTHEGIDWGKGARDRYDGEVTFTDRYVGRLLDFIGAQPWAKRTVIIVTADHGEEFGEHGMTRHGFEVWETLVHVPLMILAPAAAPRRLDVLRSGVDLAPTILELLGVAADPAYEGTSLVGEVYGAAAPERDVIVDLPATSDSGRRRALRHDDLKFVCYDSDAFCKLFDLAKDPMEKAPITRGSDFVDMRERYRTATKSIVDVMPYACGADCLNAAYRKKVGGPN